MKIKATEPILDLKEPIKSTDFVSLEKIKNQQETVGLKAIDENKHMPRVDKEVSQQKMDTVAKQDSPLTLSDWQWLKDVYKQALLLDEINRRAIRQERLKEIKLTDAEHRQTLSELKIQQRISANIKSAKELQRVRKEQEIRADLEWQEWIDKIDRKTIANKRELLELFMRSLGYKLGFIREAWNQKHLNEIKKSLSKIALEQQAEAQRLHIQEQQDLDKLKQEIAFIQKDMTLRTLNEAMLAKLFDTRAHKTLQRIEQSHVEQMLLLRSMGFKPGFLPLPAKQFELQEEVEKLERLRVEMEQKEKLNLQEFREQLAALQSAALSADGKQKILKKVATLETYKEIHSEVREEQSTARYVHEKARSLLAAIGYKLNYLPLPWKRLEILTKKAETAEVASQRASLHKKDVESLFTEKSPTKTEKELDSQPMTENSGVKNKQQPSGETMSGLASKELPPLKPKAFKPNFPAMSPKPIDINDQEDALARMKSEKEQQQIEGAQDIQLKLAQMQIAAQIAQAEAFNATPKSSERQDERLNIDIKQKIKAAK
jgi:hypothetical protein